MFKHTVGEIMHSNYVFGFTIIIPLMLTLYLNDCTKGALADSTLECLTNFYNDGNVCKECPAGYYNDNCSKVCPPSRYGKGCAQECDCLPCHHIYGCSSTPLTEETASGYFTTRDKTEDKKQASGNKLTTSETARDYFTTRDKIEGKKQTSGNKLTTSGIIIILIGSVLCFILVIVMIRELWLCCQFPQPTGKRTVINDVYADIAEIDSVKVECCSGTPKIIQTIELNSV